ncbi:MAG: thioredoxin family protein, partial [Pseudoflavonifractor sp.]
MELKILGGGCAKCNQLEAVTRQAVEQLGLEARID